MMMAFHQLVSKISANARRLFLIDACGALLSAFLLGVVLVSLEHIFGIPSSTLYFLALLPCLFAVYDGYCFLMVKGNIGQSLKGIAYLNMSYCLISIGFAIYHHEKITLLGWAYIVLESFIVIVLAAFEFKVGKMLLYNKER